MKTNLLHSREPDAGPILLAENLRIRYRAKEVLQVDHLEVPRTGVLSLIGPSGCGKSSLIKVLAGLAEADMTFDGLILDGDEPRSSRAPVAGRYAMVWQSAIVFPCSIVDNLAIPLKKRKIPRLARQAMIEEALAEVGLLAELGKGWRRVCADDLSGGQKQRLCLARGLLQDSAVFFLDEPCSALDPKSTETIERIISRLAERKAVVMVTHNMGQARRLSERVAIFCTRDGRGEVCEQGMVGECLYDPKTLEARDFLRFEVG